MDVESQGQMESKAEPTLKEFEGWHAGSTAYIVGKGPSLRYLSAENFDAFPAIIITMNEAILPVQDLDITHPIYSMQKDGLPGSMVRPHDNVFLILQKPGYSQDWYPDHPFRFHIDPINDFGFEKADVMSVRMCVAFAKLLGCTRIVFMCCDSLAGDYQTWDIQRDQITMESVGYYAAVVPEVLAEVAGMEYEIVLPGEK
jgi:hypothetical protein